MANVPMFYRTTAELYKHFRRQGIPAKYAIGAAKHEQDKRALPVDPYGGEFETDDGFTVRVEVEPDWCHIDDVAGDCFGTIHDVCYASEVRNAGVWVDDSRAYFPSSTWTFQDRVEHARKQGMARHIAWLDAIESLKREADSYRAFAESGTCCIKVTVERDEEEYASDSLGGVEDVLACLVDYDMINDALSEAREQLAGDLENDARELERSRPDMYALEVQP
jgi:hypothetical protein